MISYDRMTQPVVLARANGENANDLIMLAKKVVIHEDDKRLTEVTLSLTVPSDDPNAGGVLFLDEPRIQTGASWELRWGYFSLMSDPLALNVTVFEPDFKDDGSIAIELKLSSKGAHMTRDSRSKNWGQVQTSDIARQLATLYGFEVDIDDSQDRRRQAYVQPATKNDMEYIQGLAQAIHWVCYVDGNVLHYHPPRLDAPPVLELAWHNGDPNAILRSFKPSIKEPKSRRSARGHSGGNPHGDGDHATSGDGGHEQSHLGPRMVYNVNLRNRTSSGRVDANATAQAVVAAATAATAATAEQDGRRRQRMADADQRRTLGRANEAHGNAVGHPFLRRGKLVTVTGVGRVLGGAWYIKSSTHTLDGSYKCEFDLKRHGSARRSNSGETEHGEGNDQQAQDPQGAPRIAVVDVRSRQHIDPNGRMRAQGRRR